MPEKNLQVSLLRYTPNPEETVALAAKLCYSPLGISELKDDIKKGKNEDFVKKILSLGHLSTIEHVSFTFGIEGVSRSLLAQITRHRIASFSVKSQRYVAEKIDGEEVFNYIVPPSIKKLGPEYEKEFERQMRQIQSWYNTWYELLDSAEDARFILPNAAETKMVLTMNARELYHFFQLRCCNRAQWEIRNLAWEMLDQVKKTAPTLFSMAGPGCVFSRCPEGKMSCGKKEEVIKRYKLLGQLPE
jgi:thymidylate synthase (FAD)